MTMDPGNVTVHDDESYEGVGAALALYTVDISTLPLPTLPTLGDTSAPFAPGRPCRQSDIDQMKAARLTLLRDSARRANAYGTIVTYIQNNANIDVVVQAGLPSTGLLRLPADFVANADCIGPASDHHLSGTIA